uniref:Uncharacterized protein n=1 Tax=Arundo donax TaxID=35708 RepID=A0A0A9AQD0_ARUDO
MQHTYTASCSIIRSLITPFSSNHQSITDTNHPPGSATYTSTHDAPQKFYSCTTNESIISSTHACAQSLAPRRVCCLQGAFKRRLRRGSQAPRPPSGPVPPATQAASRGSGGAAARRP